MSETGKGDAYYKHARPKILPFIPDPCSRVLDVGCGGGLFGELLKKERNCEVWGVEPVAEAADEAKIHLDNVINKKFLKEIGLPSNHFDVIVFNDSLEHFPYPEPPLQYAKELLDLNGVLVCSIPNVRYIENVKHLLIDKDWKYTDEGILDHTHLRFFTKKSIRRTLENNGFEILKLDGINSHKWSGWKLNFLKAVFGEKIEDMRWLQFVVVARVAQ